MIETTIDGHRATLPNLYCTLPGGEIGWFQRNQNDCLRAAVATVAGVPYDDVLDTEPVGGRGGQGASLALYERVWRWAMERGLRLAFHTELPCVDGMWIGVSPLGDDGYRHTIVAKGLEKYHDPASGFLLPPGLAVERTAEIEYAITIEKETVECP